MRRLKTFLACVMVALWLPASMHCLLEDAGWVPMDESCASSPAGSHDQGDGCQFESGGAQFVPVKVAAPAFNPVAVLLRNLPEPNDPSIFPVSSGLDGAGELARSWHFTCRAALPVRAPSRLS
ncbi:MAG TPA: hypothetical protein VHH73_17170 [Verrucomicrobiae bacterium]|nr:hypothetical protein [Verrucomicrobiae bacterium]